jgi:hypothetical protein
MGWRFWAAGLVLAIGLVLWTRHQLHETDNLAPNKPGHFSFPTYFDEAVSKVAAANAFPTSGVIGYRDERFSPDPPDPARVGMHSTVRGMAQYTLAPVIVDEGSPHAQTLVHSREGTFSLDQRQPAGEQ